MDEITQKKLAKSLGASSSALIPFLPYILQDVWELGSDADDIMALMNQKKMQPPLKVLDLGCGKGAASVRIAKHFDANVKGIDIMPEFIDYARCKSGRYSANDLCSFEVKDIKKAIEEEKDYDLVVYAAMDDVLGDKEQTLRQLKKPVKEKGYIALDDVYLREGEKNPNYCTLEEWEQLFDDVDLRVVGLQSRDDYTTEQSNEYNEEKIEPRVKELMQKYPEKKELFEEYINNLKKQGELISRVLVSATWFLEK